MKKWIVFSLLVAAVVAAIFFFEEKRTESVIVDPIVKKEGTPVPELQGIEGEINTNNLKFSDLVGKKVILVDFWTYSCINCQRTLPYLTAWHEKYKDQGLEIVGVHSPEFEFEKKYENVKRAVEKWNVKYPVVLDNEHATWDAFKNRYWPAKYLVDIDGYVVWSHFGEGAYDEAEKKIQELLKERMIRLDLKDGMPIEMSKVDAPVPEFRKIGTPEIYFGANFARGNFGNPEGLKFGKSINYSLPSEFKPNQAYLDGEWFVDADFSRLVSNSGKVVLPYDAKIVNIVASSPSGSNLTIFIDGDKVSEVEVTSDDLYTLVNGDSYGKHLLEFEVTGSGFQLYTFTFG
jgi:thiol-disulfide isomerase/thioredoxin